MSNIFKVNNKDTRTTSDVSIVNFEHVLRYLLLLILLNLNKNMLVGPEERQFQTINLFFSNFEKYIVLWERKICCAINFYLYSPNLRFLKDKFSRQQFKKISQTLTTEASKIRSSRSRSYSLKWAFPKRVPVY